MLPPVVHANKYGDPQLNNMQRMRDFALPELKGAHLLRSDREESSIGPN